MLAKVSEWAMILCGAGTAFTRVYVSNFCSFILRMLSHLMHAFNFGSFSRHGIWYKNCI